MRFMFDTDESFSFETLRAVGYTSFGGADIGEVITTAERITPGDTESCPRLSPTRTSSSIGSKYRLTAWRIGKRCSACMPSLSTVSKFGAKCFSGD